MKVIPGTKFDIYVFIVKLNLVTLTTESYKAHARNKH